MPVILINSLESFAHYIDNSALWYLPPNSEVYVTQSPDHRWITEHHIQNVLVTLRDVPFPHGMTLQIQNFIFFEAFAKFCLEKLKRMPLLQLASFGYICTGHPMIDAEIRMLLQASKAHAAQPFIHASMQQRHHIMRDETIERATMPVTLFEEEARRKNVREEVLTRLRLERLEFREIRKL